MTLTAIRLAGKISMAMFSAALFGTRKTVFSLSKINRAAAKLVALTPVQEQKQKYSVINTITAAKEGLNGIKTTGPSMLISSILSETGLYRPNIFLQVAAESLVLFITRILRVINRIIIITIILII